MLSLLTRRPRRSSLALAWAATLVIAGVTGTVVSAQVQPEGGVRCPTHELVYTRIHDFPAVVQADGAVAQADGAGRSKTPEESLEKFLKKEYPKLNKDKFEKTKHGDKEAKFKLESNGSTVAEVFAVDIAGGWEISQFTACNSVAQEGQGS